MPRLDVMLLMLSLQHLYPFRDLYTPFRIIWIILELRCENIPVLCNTIHVYMPVCTSLEHQLSFQLKNCSIQQLRLVRILLPESYFRRSSFPDNLPDYNKQLLIACLLCSHNPCCLCHHHCCDSHRCDHSASHLVQSHSTLQITSAFDIIHQLLIITEGSLLIKCFNC